MPRKKYDCLKCPGYCCSYPVIEVRDRDAVRIAKHFDMPLDKAEKARLAIQSTLAWDGFDREVAAWVAALTDGTPVPVTAADGRAALAAAIAAERSLVSGDPVEVVHA